MKEKAAVCGRGESSAEGNGSACKVHWFPSFSQCCFTLRGHLLDCSHLAVPSWTLISNSTPWTLTVWLIPPFSLPREDQQGGAYSPGSGGGEHCPWSVPALSASCNFCRGVWIPPSLLFAVWSPAQTWFAWGFGHTGSIWKKIKEQWKNR